MPWTACSQRARSCRPSRTTATEERAAEQKMGDGAAEQKKGEGAARFTRRAAAPYPCVRRSPRQAAAAKAAAEDAAKAAAKDVAEAAAEDAAEAAAEDAAEAAAEDAAKDADDTGITYVRGWMSKKDADELLKGLESRGMRIYSTKAGKKMHSMPVREYYIGKQRVFRWGQTWQNYDRGREMPDLLKTVAERIEEETSEQVHAAHTLLPYARSTRALNPAAPPPTPRQVNHALVFKFADGLINYAPPLQYKRDIVSDSSTFTISVGTYARVNELITKQARGGIKLVWKEALAHGSMLKTTADTNGKFFRAVPKDRQQPGSGVAYSVVFRTVVPMEKQSVRLPGMKPMKMRYFIQQSRKSGFKRKAEDAAKAAKKKAAEKKAAKMNAEAQGKAAEARARAVLAAQKRKADQNVEGQPASKKR